MIQILKWIYNRIKSFVIFFKWLYFILWFGYRYQNIKVDKKYATLLKTKLENLGILGIKLGQYLCNRIDICTPIMKDELIVFLNNNKIHSLKHTYELLEKHNMNNIIVGDIIGSGSLTQVYRCKYNNMDYVLKVKHPEVADITMEIIAVKMIIQIFSYFKRFNMLINVNWDDFFNKIEKQVDMTNEKRFLEKYYDIYNNKITEIQTPQYIAGNEDFIVMTFCSGIPLNMIPRNSNIYRKAHNLFLSSSIHTYFTHQITHGDVHEGNILVNDDGTINIIDFGICIEYTEEQNKGISMLSKFMNEPEIDNCLSCVNSLLDKKNMYNKDVDINIFTTEIFNEYKEKYGNYRPINMGNLLNLITKYLQKYNLLIKSNILYYILNQVLLEGLSPYNEKCDISMYVALVYMKQHPFFVEEVDFFLDEYYNEVIKNLPKELIDKYKNIEF